MPSYNSANFIAESIKSIQNQSHPNWELLITDDCSEDNTIQIIENIKKEDDRIKLFRSDKNQGSGKARNNSLKNSSGKFIAFCDSDDIWHPNKLKLQIKFLNDSDYAFTFSSYEIISEEGKIIGTKRVPNQVTYLSTLINNEIGCLTVLYNREIVGDRFMDKIRKRQDYLFWLIILRDIKRAGGITTSLAKYRLRNDSISRQKFALLKYNFQVYRKLNFSVLKSSLIFGIFLTIYVLKEIKKNIKKHRGIS